MDIGGIPNKIISGVEKHATLLAFAGSAFLRQMERYPGDPELAISKLIGHFMNLGIPTPEQVGQGGYGALGEAILTLQAPEFFVRKLVGGHAYAGLFKIGVGLWIAEEFGLVPSKYGNIGKKVATGAAIAALVMPGSDGSGSSNRGSSGYGY